ncbi:hypothetical protein EU546_04705 [Candidatus Thorarchaeota archaeon]|nr:MAG: hypothetical protein EU546_04705 [Candidatus Thorarchaeota archaeon]
MRSTQGNDAFVFRATVSNFSRLATPSSVLRSCSPATPSFLVPVFSLDFVTASSPVSDIHVSPIPALGVGLSLQCRPDKIGPTSNTQWLLLNGFQDRDIFFIQKCEDSDEVATMRFGTSVMVMVLFLVAVGLPVSFSQAQGPNDLTDIRVAVYDGGEDVSTEPRESSAAALYWMFRWMNASVDVVNSSAIKQGVLEQYQILAVPGGYAYNYYLDLGYSGGNAIEDFVAAGGAYWGSCAGAYYACQEFEWTEYGDTGTYYYGLDLFLGRGVGPIAGIADWPNYAMTDVRLNTTNGLISFSEEPENHSIMYYGGPYFETEGIEGIATIATYAYNDLPAMIAFEHGNGRVFLTGPHPEWEEDSFRDGCIWDNVLDDDGSDWDLCKQVSLWLSSSNGTTGGDSLFSTVLILGIAAGFCAIVLVVAKSWLSKR